MSLFPTCSFDIAVPGAVVHAGQRLEATLQVDVPEPIERAQAIEIVFTTTASATFGFGNSRTVVDETIFECRAHIALAAHSPLAARVHRYPFALEIPASLPPRIDGPECSIAHKIEARLDVDWAIDPRVEFEPLVAPAPRRGERRPISVHSPPRFHDAIVVEVTLQSAVVEQGEGIRGSVALRSGHDARFESVDIAVVEIFDIRLGGRTALRTKRHEPVRVPADALQHGDAASFVVPTSAVPASFEDARLCHRVLLVVALSVPWATDPEFTIELELLPRGSFIGGALVALAVGRERLRRLADLMAARSGLRAGTPPVLVEGSTNGVDFRVVDAPSAGRMGLAIEMTFPDLQLDIECGPRRVLTFGARRPLPDSLDAHYSLEHAERRSGASLDDVALSAFFAAAFADLEGPESVRMTDTHYAVRWVVNERESVPFTDAALFARRKADQLARSIAALPFPTGARTSADTWRAAAAELGATLVPTGPALWSVPFVKRLQTGEERALTASIVTRWNGNGDRAATEVTFDLSQAAVPAEARAALEHDQDSTHLRAVRSVFSRVSIQLNGATATFERPGLTHDPRELMAALDAFVTWAIEARGERIAYSAYR